MGRELTEFHGIAADMLIHAKRKHDGRDALGPYLCPASQDAVTVWRRTAHLINGYANGADVRGRRPNWSAFWEDGIDRAGMLALVTERSRFNRCQEDGSAPYSDDSVTHWEYGLARELMFTHSLAGSPLAAGDADTVRRLGLDHEVTVNVAVAYTGLNIADVRRAVTAADGQEPSYGYAEDRTGREYASHPVLDLITTNRPTV